MNKIEIKNLYLIFGSEKQKDPSDVERKAGLCNVENIIFYL